MSRPVSYASTAKTPALYQQQEEVLYQGNKAVVELVLDLVDKPDYLLKLANNSYIPVMESEITKK